MYKNAYVCTVPGKEIFVNNITLMSNMGVYAVTCLLLYHLRYKIGSLLLFYSGIVKLNVINLCYPIVFFKPFGGAKFNSINLGYRIVFSLTRKRS